MSTPEQIVAALKAFRLRNDGEFTDAEEAAIDGAIDLISQWKANPWTQLYCERGCVVLYNADGGGRRYIVIEQEDATETYETSPAWRYGTYREAMDQVKRLATESLYRETQDALCDFDTASPSAASLLGSILSALKSAKEVAHVD
jgi:hypothetical protein